MSSAHHRVSVAQCGCRVGLHRTEGLLFFHTVPNRGDFSSNRATSLRQSASQSAGPALPGTVLFAPSAGLAGRRRRSWRPKHRSCCPKRRSFCRKNRPWRLRCRSFWRKHRSFCAKYRSFCPEHRSFWPGIGLFGEKTGLQRPVSPRFGRRMDRKTLFSSQLQRKPNQRK